MNNMSIYLKRIVKEEYIQAKHSLTETAAGWPTINKLFTDAGLKPWKNRFGNQVFTYDDPKLGIIDLYDDGSVIIQAQDKETTWTIVGSNKISVDNNIIDIAKNKLSKKSSTSPKRVKATAREKISGIDTLQTVLDWLGFIPIFGDILDVVNALIYFAREKWIDGILSLVAVIPLVGSGIKLALKGAIDLGGGAWKVSKMWKKAAKGGPDDLINFYRESIKNGSIDKMQLIQIAAKGDEIAKLLTAGNAYLKKHEYAVTALGISNPIAMKQIDQLIDILQNTVTIPIKKSLFGRIKDVTKLSKVANKGLRAGKFAFNFTANIFTFGGFGVAKNILKKIGISQREMKYLKDAMDLRFARKLEQSTTLTAAMLKSNNRLTSAAATSLGIPPWLRSKSVSDIQAWMSTVKQTNPKKWKQISNAIAKQSADSKNIYYTKFVEDKFQQASNIFRPGTVFVAGIPEMFSRMMRLDSYRLSNPKNLDIVWNEMQDLAEKLGMDPQDDPNGVIMPAIFMLFNEYIMKGKETVSDIIPGSDADSTTTPIIPTPVDNAQASIPGGTVVDNTSDVGLSSIKTEFKNAPGTTTEKLQALADQGWEEAQIFALKRALDIE